MKRSRENRPESDSLCTWGDIQNQKTVILSANSADIDWSTLDVREFGLTAFLRKK